MEIVNRIKEQMGRENAQRATIKKERQKYVEELKKEEKFYLDLKTWQAFLDVANCRTGCAAERLKAAEDFLAKAIAERKDLQELIIDVFDPYGMGYLHAVTPAKLPQPTDKKTIKELKKEAKKYNLDYGLYLNALFYSRVVKLNREKREREEERERRRRDNEHVRAGGTIDPTLRKKLEKRFGKPIFRKYDYFDMLVDLANEYLG